MMRRICQGETNLRLMTNIMHGSVSTEANTGIGLETTAANTTGIGERSMDTRTRRNGRWRIATKS